MPKDPVGPGPGDGGGHAGLADPRREGADATETRRRVARPSRFKVLLYNDDYTPMEFVVDVLERIFEKSPSAATRIMLEIHNGGLGVASYVLLSILE